MPFEESVGTLKELRDEGKIRHVGLSNVSREQLERARAIVPIVSVQNRYSVADRASEDVLELCERAGIAFLPWFPLGAGALADADGPLARVAERHGATPAQVAIAWLLHRSPVICPIPGTSSLAHLEENVAAARIELSAVDLGDLGCALASPGHHVRRPSSRIGRGNDERPDDERVDHDAEGDREPELEQRLEWEQHQHEERPREDDARARDHAAGADETRDDAVAVAAAAGDLLRARARSGRSSSRFRARP